MVCLRIIRTSYKLSILSKCPFPQKLLPPTFCLNMKFYFLRTLFITFSYEFNDKIALGDNFMYRCNDFRSLHPSDIWISWMLAPSKIIRIAFRFLSEWSRNVAFLRIDCKLTSLNGVSLLRSQLNSSLVFVYGSSKIGSSNENEKFTGRLFCLSFSSVTKNSFPSFSTADDLIRWISIARLPDATIISTSIRGSSLILEHKF